MSLGNRYTAGENVSFAVHTRRCDLLMRNVTHRVSERRGGYFGMSNLSNVGRTAPYVFVLMRISRERQTLAPRETSPLTSPVA